MSREIKFRAWDNETKILHEWNHVRFWDFDCVTWQSFEFMQYTGLKDKNGKEIYEGDILRVTKIMAYKFSKEGKVEYMEDFAGFAVVGEWSKNQYYELLTCDVAIDCEIISNIYEHPHLLKP